MNAYKHLTDYLIEQTGEPKGTLSYDSDEIRVGKNFIQKKDPQPKWLRAFETVIELTF